MGGRKNIFARSARRMFYPPHFLNRGAAPALQQYSASGRWGQSYATAFRILYANNSNIDLRHYI